MTRNERQVLESPLPRMGWYPADAASLRAEIDECRVAAREAGAGPIANVCALLQPHAGLRFSGPVAAWGLEAIGEERYDRVVVLGPTHRVRLPNRASLPEATDLATPLGEIPLDREAMETLRASPVFVHEPTAHREEHSVQIQAPLLQAVLGSFRLVPVVVGQLDEDGARALAEAIRPILDETTLLVVSTDFTHFGPRFGYMPFRENIPQRLEALDLGAWERIEAGDAAGFRAYCEETGATICGRDPVSVLLHLLPPDSRARKLRYDTSARITGEAGDSVSYLSAAFTGSWSRSSSSAEEEATASAPEQATRPVASDADAATEQAATGEAGAPTLTEAEKNGLLELARASIRAAFLGEAHPAGEYGIPVTEGMRAVMGAFVTLHIGAALRGCIGEILPRRALAEAVVENARNAAFRDPRFPPLTKEEEPAVRLEISALTPPRPVSGPDAIEIGRHGILIEHGGRGAVFLPQVAPDQGWDLETTLAHLCRKAGLPADAWRDEQMRFTVFEAIVFAERERG